MGGVPDGRGRGRGARSRVWRVGLADTSIKPATNRLAPIGPTEEEPCAHFFTQVGGSRQPQTSKNGLDNAVRRGYPRYVSSSRITRLICVVAALSGCKVGSGQSLPADPSSPSSPADVTAWLKSQFKKSLSPFEGWPASKLTWTRTTVRQVDPIAVQALQEEVRNKVDHPKRQQLDMLQAFAREPVIVETFSLWFGNGGPVDRWRYSRESPDDQNPGKITNTELARNGTSAWIVSNGAQTLLTLDRSLQTGSASEFEQTVAVTERELRQFFLDWQYGGIRSAGNLQNVQSIELSEITPNSWKATVRWPPGTESLLEGSWTAANAEGLVRLRKVGSATISYEQETVRAPNGNRLVKGFRYQVAKGIDSYMGNLEVVSIDDGVLSQMLEPQHAADVGATISHQRLNRTVDLRSDSAFTTYYDEEGTAVRIVPHAGPNNQRNALNRAGQYLLYTLGAAFLVGVLFRLRRKSLSV